MPSFKGPKRIVDLMSRDPSKHLLLSVDLNNSAATGVPQGAPEFVALVRASDSTGTRAREAFLAYIYTHPERGRILRAIFKNR
jgi:hypothetical protein